MRRRARALLVLVRLELKEEEKQLLAWLGEVVIEVMRLARLNRNRWFWKVSKDFQKSVCATDELHCAVGRHFLNQGDHRKFCGAAERFARRHVEELACEVFLFKEAGFRRGRHFLSPLLPLSRSNLASLDATVILSKLTTPFSSSVSALVSMNNKSFLASSVRCVTS